MMISWHFVKSHKWLFAVLLLLAGIITANGGSLNMALTGIFLVLFAAFIDWALARAQQGEPVNKPAVVLVPGKEGKNSAKLLLSALPDPAFLLRSDGQIVFQNTKAIEVFGQSGRGRSLGSVLRSPQISEAINTVTSTGNAETVEFTDRGLVERWFDAFIVPVDRKIVPPARGQPKKAGVLLLLRDMTKQQKIERMRVDFVANASHELRTPLASMIGFIETLQGPAKQDVAAREKFLDLMLLQALRMSRLIADLLSLSRIELNAHLRPQDTVNLGEVIGHVADTLRQLAADEGVAISVQPDVSDPIILGDRDELIQVFQNLIENAVKYGKSGKRVDIVIRSIQTDAATARYGVAVKDYGPGIDKNDLPRITERFYRTDVAASREKGGTGLGLAIVKHILNRHGGSLEVSSQLGGGARFEVLLDAHAQPATVVAQAGFAQEESEKTS